jgi:hypothetical protein
LLRFCGTSLPSTSRLVPGLPTRCKRQTNSRVHSVRMGGTQGGVQRLAAGLLSALYSA